MATNTPQADAGLPEERKYKRTAQYVSDAIWALHPAALATILQIIGERRQGYKPTAEEIRERIGGREPTEAPTDEPVGPVAVLEINGPIFPKAGLMTELSGATSIEALRADFRAALANPDVKAILLNIDSPGGSVDQVPEMAAEILAARGKKPIVAQANGWAASAAYHLASAADEIAVTPSGEVGSIGVYTAHDDLSAAQEKLGIKTTLISAGKYKTEGNPLEPLGDEARAEMQSRVDAFYQMFVSAVAQGRGVPVEDVIGGFGEGRMVMAAKAVKLGMADRVATFDQTLARLEKLSTPQAQRSAQTVERRTIPIEGVEWRTSNASGELKMIVRGHAAVFDRLSLNLGGFKEKFAADAFDEVLDQDPDVHLDWEHLGTHTLARTRSSKYQLELRRDPRGLHFYATVAPTSYAQDLRILMESQVIDQASVVFATPEDGSGEKWEMDRNGDIVRTVTKVSGLYGVCVCAQGAYPQTDTAVVRNLRSRLTAEIEGGRLPKAAAHLLPDVAPDDPAGRPTSQHLLGEANDQRIVAPDDPAGAPSSREAGEERVAARKLEALNMAVAIAEENERKRDFERRKYRLSGSPTREK